MDHEPEGDTPRLRTRWQRFWHDNAYGLVYEVINDLHDLLRRRAGRASQPNQPAAPPADEQTTTK